MAFTPRNTLRNLTLLTLAALCLNSSGCATRSHVAHDYGAVLDENPKLARRTVILFLIDGLSEQTLQRALPAMPNVRSFFATDQATYRAHSPFPSLTFPGISSLLKERPVSQTGFIGNSFYLNDEVVNFEKPFKRKTIGDLMEHDTVFARLKARGQRSVSLDYGIGVNASTYSPIEDLSSVFSIAQGDYSYVDSKKIEAVHVLLSEHPPEDWPSFIFVHLIGVDFLSHSDGPLAATTVGYLMSLDDKLKPLLELLQVKEKGHQVISVVTADHGFNGQVKYFLDIEQLIAKVSKKTDIFNEARMAAVFVRDRKQKNSATEALSNSLLKYKGIELIALKTANGFSVESANQKITVQLRAAPECLDDKIAMLIQGSSWICPSALSSQDPFNHPFFLSNLAHYFSSSNSPDLVAIPDSETAFSKSYVGFHGGPTAGETMVPVLMRNTSMTAGQAPPLWRLLPQIVK